jgi:hypothetical protein
MTAYNYEGEEQSFILQICRNILVMLQGIPV